jgi:hypothetical protein
LDDDEFREAFERGALPEGAFRHRDHVRLAWLYLRRLPPAAALERFAEGLRRFAASVGKSGLYHETITWAFLLLIRERMGRGGEDTWPAFAERNPDLLAWKPSILDRYYRSETLASDLARRVFVLPDRLAEGDLEAFSAPAVREDAGDPPPIR